MDEVNQNNDIIVTIQQLTLEHKKDVTSLLLSQVPNIVEALTRAYSLPITSFEFTACEVQGIEGTEYDVVITYCVNYNPEEVNTPLLTKDVLSGVTSAVEYSCIDVPASMVTADPDEIVQHIIDQFAALPNDNYVDTISGFDPRELTQNQVHQMLYFQEYSLANVQ